MFNLLQTKIEDALKGGWAVKDIETSIHLHDALLGLRHWGADIKNDEESVLNKVENEGNSDLAASIRSYLTDINNDIIEFHAFLNDHGDEKSRQTRERLKTRLQASVKCLRLQYEPLRTFAEVVNQSGKVAFLLQKATSWQEQQRDRNTSGSPAIDVFSTVVTAGGLTLDFLGACSAYSDEAKFLQVRFDWDLRSLEKIRLYFAQRQAQSENGQLLPKDADLLEHTSKYLDNFVDKLQRSLRKIERKGLLGGVTNRGMWIARRSDLQDMEREIYEWTRRFGVHVLGLPPELRMIIPVTATGNESGDEGSPPAIVRSNNRLQWFLALASNAKRTRAREMLLKDADELVSKITDWSYASSRPLQHGTEQLVFAGRRVSPGMIPGTPDFDQLVFDMGELAAALNCLDPASDIRLLKVEYYFYHEESKQFLFAQKPPYPIMSMMTLEDVIRHDPFPKVDAALNQRLKVAYKLAEAVFFLHAAGYLHRSITSSSVVALQRSEGSPGEISPSFLDDAYLMGFDLMRGTGARTKEEGADKENEKPRPIWDFDIFQHPDRLQGKDSRKYTKSYDVYSLGVVLLQVGFWEPLTQVVGNLNERDPSGWAKELSEIAPNMNLRTGERYQRLVRWCLGLKGDYIVGDTEFVQEVLDPLEEMLDALS